MTSNLPTAQASRMHYQDIKEYGLPVCIITDTRETVRDRDRNDVYIGSHAEILNILNSPEEDCTGTITVITPELVHIKTDSGCTLKLGAQNIGLVDSNTEQPSEYKW